MRSRQPEEEHVDVIITPFIDVFIFLLIAFMAGTILQRVTNSLEIDLPKTDHATKATTPDEMLIISIVPKQTAGSLQYQYLIGTEPVGRNALMKELHSRGEQNLDQRIRIDCDQSVPFRELAYIVDMCSFAGLHNVGMRTKDSVGR